MAIQYPVITIITINNSSKLILKMLLTSIAHYALPIVIDAIKVNSLHCPGDTQLFMMLQQSNRLMSFPADCHHRRPTMCSY